MKRYEFLSYLTARFVVAAASDVVAYVVTFAAWEVVDLGRVRRMTRRKP